MAAVAVTGPGGRERESAGGGGMGCVRGPHASMRHGEPVLGLLFKLAARSVQVHACVAAGQKASAKPRLLLRRWDHAQLLVLYVVMDTVQL